MDQKSPITQSVFLLFVHMLFFIVLCACALHARPCSSSRCGWMLELKSSSPMPSAWAASPLWEVTMPMTITATGKKKRKQAQTIGRMIWRRFSCFRCVVLLNAASFCTFCTTEFPFFTRHVHGSLRSLRCRVD